MIFPTIVNDTHRWRNVPGSTDQKLYYRLLDMKGRPTPCRKRLQKRQTKQRLQQEYPETNAAEYYGA
jgi:hypothetical protein